MLLEDVILTCHKDVVKMFSPVCSSCLKRFNLSSVGPADVGDIQSRLLDHRPVINAEIRYFVREFEVLDMKLSCNSVA